MCVCMFLTTALSKSRPKLSPPDSKLMRKSSAEKRLFDSSVVTSARKFRPLNISDVVTAVGSPSVYVRIVCVSVLFWGAYIDMFWSVRNTFDAETAVASSSVYVRIVCVCVFVGRTY